MLASVGLQLRSGWRCQETHRRARLRRPRSAGSASCTRWVPACSARCSAATTRSTIGRSRSRRSPSTSPPNRRATSPTTSAGCRRSPSKHPSIIAPFAAGADGSTAYLVQEYFVAESADVALKQYGPAPVPDAMRLIGQLAGALDFAAAAGVHHGALHPRDILVAPHEVRLSGLGVVEALERVGYRAPVRRPYAAPERAAGHAVRAARPTSSRWPACRTSCSPGRRPSLAGESVTVETRRDPVGRPGGAGRGVRARAERAAGRPPRFRARVRRRAEARADRRAAGHRRRGGTAEDPARAARRRPEGAGGAERGRRRPRRAPRRAPSRWSSPPEPAPAEAELLPAAPAPGSTPLPAFLEAYRPGPEPAESGSSSEPGQPMPAGQAAMPEAGAAEPLDQELALFQDALFEDAVRRPKDALDLDALDRRTEMTAAVTVVVPRPRRAGGRGRLGAGCRGAGCRRALASRSPRRPRRSTWSRSRAAGGRSRRRAEADGVLPRRGSPGTREPAAARSRHVRKRAARACRPTRRGRGSALVPMLGMLLVGNPDRVLPGLFRRADACARVRAAAAGDRPRPAANSPRRPPRHAAGADAAGVAAARSPAETAVSGQPSQASTTGGTSPRREPPRPREPGPRPAQCARRRRRPDGPPLRPRRSRAGSRTAFEGSLVVASKPGGRDRAARRAPGRHDAADAAGGDGGRARDPARAGRLPGLVVVRSR